MSFLEPRIHASSTSSGFSIFRIPFGQRPAESFDRLAVQLVASDTRCTRHRAPHCLRTRPVVSQGDR
eukprot:2593106-Alexandrium_andersonii.AAC.1